MPAVKYEQFDSVIEDNLKAVADDMQKIGLSAAEALEKAKKEIIAKSDELN